MRNLFFFFFFFFQAEDGIRDLTVTGVQTCALPITYAVATNKSPEGPYRGVGMVTAVLVHERLLDLIAARLGLDAAEVRRLNFVRSEQMPYLSVTRHPYESGDYAAALDAAMRAFDYAGARQEQAAARAEGRLVGIGIGSY